MNNRTLAILAGGKSSRMNYNNKALIKHNEKTFIQHIIDVGSDFQEVIIIANEEEYYLDLGVSVYKDIYKGEGPLSGIHSALKNAKNEYVLCVACDMPMLDKEVITYIASYEGAFDIIVPACNDNIQPLCALYSKRTIPNIEEALINKNRRLKNLIYSVNYKIISGLGHREFVEDDFLNINTPIDLKRLEE